MGLWLILGPACGWPLYVSGPHKPARERQRDIPSPSLAVAGPREATHCWKGIAWAWGRGEGGLLSCWGKGGGLRGKNQAEWEGGEGRGDRKGAGCLVAIRPGQKGLIQTPPDTRLSPGLCGGALRSQQSC